MQSQQFLKPDMYYINSFKEKRCTLMRGTPQPVNKPLSGFIDK